MSKVDPNIILDAIESIPADGLSSLSISVHYKPDGAVDSVFFYRNHNKRNVNSAQYEDLFHGEIFINYADYYLEEESHD